MALEEKDTGQGGMRIEGHVSISMPLHTVHTLYLVSNRLAEHLDCNELTTPEELYPLLDLIRDILPPREMMNGIYAHMMKGPRHGSTKAQHAWSLGTTP